MTYRIRNEQIFIFQDDGKGTPFTFWPEDLVKLVEAQEAGSVDDVVPNFKEILSDIMEEHPDLFTCFYNSDVIT